MSGFTATLRKHPSLIPLFFCVGAGGLAAFLYTMRLAIKNPDVAWRVKDNPLPNNDYANKRYQFYNPSGQEAKCPAPKY